MFSIVIIFLTAVNCDLFALNECPNDWFNYENKKCFKLLTETKVNYTEADNRCRQLNASLVTIESEDENLFITSLLYDLDNEVKGLYIGLKRKTENDSYLNEFEWTGGQQLVYENWAPEEPSPWFEPCVEVFSVDITAGKWNDISCNAKRYAICYQTIKTPINKYSTGFEYCEHLEYIQYRNNCYKVYDQWSALNWTNADIQCKKDHTNGTLLYIEDSYEHSFIKYWTKREMKSIEFWIGLNAKNNSLNIEYEWSNEWPLYFTAWAPLEPKFRPDLDTQCVIQDRDSGLWRNDPFCSDSRAFICKITKHSLPEDLTYVSGVCPQAVNITTGQSTERWINLHKQTKHCHWFSNTLALNWSSGSKYCRQRNGTLVSIHSLHESALLKPFVQKYGRRIWIGLYQSPSGHFRWEDGSDLDFQNWFPGEPTDEENELCVEMRAQDMAWNDVECSKNELEFICEINKIIDHLNDTNVDQMSETNGQSEVVQKWVVWMLAMALVLITGLSIGAYIWFNKYQINISENCFCFQYLSRNPLNSSGVNSNRSSVNEANSFDISY